MLGCDNLNVLFSPTVCYSMSNSVLNKWVAISYLTQNSFFYEDSRLDF